MYNLRTQSNLIRIVFELKTFGIKQKNMLIKEMRCIKITLLVTLATMLILIADRR